MTAKRNTKVEFCSIFNLQLMAEARENNILNLTVIWLIASADLNYTFERGSEKKNDEK